MKFYFLFFKSLSVNLFYISKVNLLAFLITNHLFSINKTIQLRSFIYLLQFLLSFLDHRKQI